MTVDFAPTPPPVAQTLGRRIVIADAYEPTRVLLRTLIELEGMQVVGEAEDGSEAVALALELEPDVLLLDVCMPGLQIQVVLQSADPLETALGRAAALQLPLADKRDLHETIEQLAREA